MKEIEQRMLCELVRNSRRSDRELAKAIGTSQPTATRVRTKLEKEGYIKEYTALPDIAKIGYSIMALHFLKLDLRLTQQELQEFKISHCEAIMKSNCPVFICKNGMGLGYNAVILSLHENYHSCDQFRMAMRESMPQYLTDMDTFLINLADEKMGLPFSFGLFASQLKPPSAKTQQNQQ
ncbi:MAG: Lrp/AsnC family transcriptional regulator [Candidatus Bathyarchaeia archaeon]